MIVDGGRRRAARPALGDMVMVLLFVGACTSAGDATPRIEDRDYFTFSDTLASQVRDLSSTELDNAPRWPVDSEPVQRVGDPSGAGAFGHVSYALRLADGNFLGADADRGEVLAFDREGRFMKVWGRSGQAAGEFQRPAWLGLCNGSVYAYDGGLRVVHVFNATGSFVRTFRPLIPSHTGAAYQAHASRPFACNTRGLLAATATMGRTSGTDMTAEGHVNVGAYRTLDLVGTSDGEGTFSALLTVPGEDRYRTRTGSGPRQPDGRKPIIAMSDDHVFVATGDAYEIAAYSIGDNAWRMIRIKDRIRTPITVPEVIAIKREALADTQLTKGIRTALAHTLDGMTWPAFHPMIKNLLVDSRQCLWVMDGHPTRPLSRWSVFTQDGTPIGTVSIPGTFRVMQVDGTTLIGRERGHDGVDHIVLYRYHDRGNHTC